MIAARSPGTAASGHTEARRYLALDALRGFVMLVLVSHAFGLGKIKEPGLQWLAGKFQHVRWEGFVPWELVMPSFLLLSSPPQRP